MFIFPNNASFLKIVLLQNMANKSKSTPTLIFSASLLPWHSGILEYYCVMKQCPLESMTKTLVPLTCSSPTVLFFFHLLSERNGYHPSFPWKSCKISLYRLASLVSVWSLILQWDLRFPSTLAGLSKLQILLKHQKQHQLFGGSWDLGVNVSIKNDPKNFKICEVS